MVITHVCLSDLHLGEEDGILTTQWSDRPDDPAAVPHVRASSALEELTRGLRALIGDNGGFRPTLILNGDILELALTGTHVALMGFQRFLEEVMPRGQELFASEIIYLPGNHDHHLWEMARETAYCEWLRHTDDELLRPPWHATNLFPTTKRELPTIPVLDALVEHRMGRGDEITIRAAYPNFAIEGRGGGAVVFHHGHFTDPLYTKLTSLYETLFGDGRSPNDLDVWDLEQENFAWIDFVWSTLGRSGRVGGMTETIYECSLEKDGLRPLVHRALDRVAEEIDLPGILRDKEEARVLKGLYDLLVQREARLERRQRESLSPRLDVGLCGYVSGPVLKQLAAEGRPRPAPLTFVFGHTHKPYFGHRRLPGELAVEVHNTGGWVVEGSRSQPDLGASVALVDDRLNVASVRLYRETEADGPSAVEVQAADRREDWNDLVVELDSRLSRDARDWQRFSIEVSRELSVRRRELTRRLARKTAP